MPAAATAVLRSSVLWVTQRYPSDCLAATFSSSPTCVLAFSCALLLLRPLDTSWRCCSTLSLSLSLSLLATLVASSSRRCCPAFFDALGHPAMTPPFTFPWPYFAGVKCRGVIRPPIRYWWSNPTRDKATWPAAGAEGCHAGGSCPALCSLHSRDRFGRGGTQRARTSPHLLLRIHGQPLHNGEALGLGVGNRRPSSMCQ